MGMQSVIDPHPEARPLVDAALQAVVPALNWFYIDCGRAPEAASSDPAALLRILKAGLSGPQHDRRWPDVDPEVRALAFEIGSLRNRHAHHEVFTYEEAFRGISSTYRMLVLLGAPGADATVQLLDDLHLLLAASAPAAPDEDGIDDELDERLLSTSDNEDEHDLEAVPPISSLERTASGPAAPVSTTSRRIGTGSVADLIWDHFGVEVPAGGAFGDENWHLSGTTDVPCPICRDDLAVCRQGKPPEGRDSRPWACVCTTCGTVRRMLSYDVRTKAKLRAWADVGIPADQRHL